MMEYPSSSLAMFSPLSNSKNKDRAMTNDAKFFWFGLPFVALWVFILALHVFRSLPV